MLTTHAEHDLTQHQRTIEAMHNVLRVLNSNRSLDEILPLSSRSLDSSSTAMRRRSICWTKTSGFTCRHLKAWMPA